MSMVYIEKSEIMFSIVADYPNEYTNCFHHGDKDDKYTTISSSLKRQRRVLQMNAA